jgi:hypothetical protein
MPGTTNLKCVRRLCLRAFDVFAKGTANAATSLVRSERRQSYKTDLFLLRFKPILKRSHTRIYFLRIAIA